MDLGIVTRITGSLASIFYLTGAFKNTIHDIWVKRLSYIGSGFSIGMVFFSLFRIEKYYQLKEFKLSLEYQSLYTYQNLQLIPKMFQEEMGIPKLVYTIGEKFPIVASLSGRLNLPKDHRSHDDSECEIVEKSHKHKKSHRRFFSYEGQSLPSVDSDSLNEKKSDSEAGGSVFKSGHNPFLTTKDHLVKMWLNINEKVSSKSKLMKEQSDVLIINHD